MEERITELLNALTDPRADLFRLGIKGHILGRAWGSECCPVEAYLEANGVPFAFIANGSVYTTPVSLDGKEPGVAIPTAVLKFMKAFDFGHYPELKREKTQPPPAELETQNA